MSNNLYKEYVRLQSIRRFINGIVNDICFRRSVIVLLPTTLKPEIIWPEIQTELRYRGVNEQYINLQASPNHQNPVSILVECLNLKWSDHQTPHTLSNLPDCENLPDAICLGGLQNLDEDLTEAWIKTLEIWAQMSQQKKNLGYMPSSICVVAPAELLISMLPESNVFLSYHWWWGIPSILETRFLCRFVEESDNNSISARWREFILPSLSAGDIELLQVLWNTYDSPIKNLTDMLNKYASDLLWVKEDLINLNILNHKYGRNNHSHMKQPPKSIIKLWSKGLINYTPEYGLEVHSAALSITNQEDIITHRLWRGQSEFLLPILESIRLDICQKLTDQFGEHWPIKWDQPNNEEELKEVKDNPLAASWGYLVHLLRTVKKLHDYVHLQPIAIQCKRMRNFLAHHRTVDLQSYEHIQEELNSITTM